MKGDTGPKGDRGARGPTGHVVVPTSLAIKIAVVFTVIVLGLSWGMTLYISSRDKNQALKRQQQQSLVQCQRTREFSPGVGAFLARHNVFTDRVLRDYFATIPKSCR